MPKSKRPMHPKRDPFAGDKLAPDLIGGLALQAGFPLAELPTAIAVALAESGGRRKAVGHNSNGSTDNGLWQINSIHAGTFPGLWSQRFNGVANAQMAKAIYDDAGGWSPWVTYKTGAYKTHMATATRAAKVAEDGPSMEKGAHEINPAELAQGAAATVADSLGNMFGVLTAAARWMGDAHNWLRVAFVAGGALALLAGLVMLGQATGATGAVSKVATKAVTKATPAGRLAKAVTK